MATRFPNRITRKDFYLPHLGYTVRLRPFNRETAPSKAKDALAYVLHDNEDQCTMYLPRDATPSLIAHEIIHVLQFMCRDLNMTFETEMEHMAYVMQYLLGSILGYRWEKAE